MALSGGSAAALGCSIGWRRRIGCSFLRSRALPRCFPSGCEHSQARPRMGSWPAPLLQLVGSEAEDERVYADRSAALLAALRSQQPAPRAVELVTALGPFLTGEDDAARARATEALAEVRPG